MAAGHIHNIATSMASGAAVALAVVNHSTGLAALAAGIALGLLLSPDLDERHGSVSNSNFRQIVPLLARPWRAVWWVYARLIPCHRHWLSHAPLIGTLGRLLYLSPWMLLLYLFFNFPPEQSWPYWAMAAGGLGLSDILHWLMDGMPLYR
jgi:uncharacterized metal-binding protein